MTQERKDLLTMALVGLAHEREQIDLRIAAIKAELNGNEKRGPGRPKLVKTRKMSADGRAKIAAAAKKRWAAFRKARKAA